MSLRFANRYWTTGTCPHGLVGTELKCFKPGSVTGEFSFWAGIWFFFAHLCMTEDAEAVFVPFGNMSLKSTVTCARGGGE